MLAAESDDEEDEEEEDSGVEEMIVTGSHIRRTNFDLPSPIDVIGELDMELSGTPDLGDVDLRSNLPDRRQCQHQHHRKSAARTTRVPARAGTRA